MAVAVVAIGLAAAGGWWWFSTRREATIVSTAPPVLPSAARAEDREPQSLCPDTGTRAFDYDQLQVVVTQQEPFLCRVVVRTRAGGTLAEATQAAVSGEYVDLDADGAPELIVVADSGGSGGFTDWFVFTQRPEPRLAGMMMDACRIAAGPPIPGGRGRVLSTCDLAWAFHDGLCNACSPRPLVFYQLQAGQLTDANRLMVSEYDRYIADARKALDETELQEFTAATGDDDGGYQQDYVRGGVLGIVLAYRYSGRTDEARGVVERWWPAFDRDRILEEIVGSR